MEEKLKRIKELRVQRTQIDAEIKTLSAEVESEVKVMLHGQRKPRKPKQK
ncbi:hypothetical protein JJE66_33860 [Bradyrhizobium diazoefficiens]|nr:hypothetical protein [Bradyrhizobium diazoefficiens]MBK3666195.1 hypothetical protein [Bradyrhizobium diazoefficiens]